ncbi:MAG: hypothetical protein ACLGJD_10820 [Gammaproteobacteria bacterium]|uniref:hypothetical protein n=1 Tax=uncultured Pseudacidovorax sp. TaxID=679313 RepID=UPI0025ED26E5|nr:hypothetical protein [uncultured Pseudacidovorax sp.]
MSAATSAGRVSSTFFQVDLVQEGDAAPVSYFIFMSARKEMPENAQKRIRVQVESAYPELPNVRSPEFVRTENLMEIFGRLWSDEA